MTINRRIFLRASAFAMAGVGLAPAWLARAASSGSGSRRKVLVALFQRGAMDGLNAVIPFSDKRYYEMRPTIAMPAPGKEGGALDLNGSFALHPSLAPLHSLWKRNQLAVIHAAGSPDPTRSHFDAQDYMESGTPGRKSTRDGWLNRALPADATAQANPLRAISMGPRLARTVRGANSAIAINSIHDFKLREAQSKDALESMYAGTRDAGLVTPGRDAFEAMKLVKAIDRAPYSPAAGASYPGSNLGRSLQQIARLIKADVGVEVAFAEQGGWDTHTAESQRLPGLLADLAGSIGAFCTDLGDRFEDVMLVTMSEFGRTARENGNGGTDHGHANAMFVASGSASLKGGLVHGKWPGLEQEQLYEERDLAVTTDFRSVLGELVSTHLGVADLDRVFPGAAGARARVGLLG